MGGRQPGGGGARGCTRAGTLAAGSSVRHTHTHTHTSTPAQVHHLQTDAGPACPGQSHSTAGQKRALGTSGCVHYEGWCWGCQKFAQGWGAFLPWAQDMVPLQRPSRALDWVPARVPPPHGASFPPGWRGWSQHTSLGHQLPGGAQALEGSSSPSLPCGLGRLP